ncbi:hypothetical protein RJ639_046525 [Escallonia herrerae]|uniref:Uncharacterized protein n=1 Tax=Escallonia herrerae TaxID=1293975 RepID=A0AA88W5W9_9ASTE|nr:hypothetical protein RJ639_046525 [Escallonia herrerae]
MDGIVQLHEILVNFRLLVSGDSLILLFAPEDIVQSCSDLLVSTIAGVSPLFQTGKFEGRHLFKLPAAVILASSDSSGVIPPVSKLSPGQAAYHFLAGYQNGKFIPVYGEGCCTFDPLELAKALLTKLQENQISAFLMNVREGEKQISGGDLRAKYKSFLSGKFQELPEDFSF